MKHGIRKPSIKKSIAARTTGKAKRALKKAIMPSYGQKGMGIFHPSRSAYNKLYHKTTISINDINKDTKENNKNYQSFKFDGVTIGVTLICAMGVFCFIFLLYICFGPCKHDWRYVSYKNDYQCTKCNKLKKQEECPHVWETIENNRNWKQRKCRLCGKISTEKKF